MINVLVLNKNLFDVLIDDLQLGEESVNGAMKF